MRVAIKKGVARGEICAPPSKSMAHRLLISAALAEGESTVRGIPFCDDVLATLDCLNALGIATEISGSDVTVHGRRISALDTGTVLECRESGSTLRFMIPLLLLSGKRATLHGAPSLMSRPMSVYEELAKEQGFEYAAKGDTISLKGRLTGGDLELRGNVSSQFISGLLFALPLADEDSTLHITTAVESRSYIDLTLSALREFGVLAEWSDDYTLKIRGRQSYAPSDVRVEGDYSGAAFPAALALFGGNVHIAGLKEDSIQGDRAYARHFEALMRGIPTIHIGDCPDLGPVLFAVAAAKNGGIFDGTRRLKIKESDRAAAMAVELMKFGASVSVYEDSVVIYPKSFHAPREPLCGHNDHRIVMALSVLLTLTGGELTGAEAVAKSYPAFFDDLEALGIELARYEE